MAKDSSLKVFVVGEVLRASHLNQMTENVGAVGYLAPYNSQLSRDSAGVVFLGTTDAALGGIVLKAGYKFLESDGTNTTDITLGGGGGNNLLNIETLSAQEKLGNPYSISEKYYINESYTNLDKGFMRLGRSYGTGDGSNIYLHPNYTSLSKCNSLSDGSGVWTSFGPQAAAATVGGTTSIESGASIYSVISATTAENGLKYVLGTGGIVNLTDKKLRYAINLSTISNISTIKTTIGDSRQGTANSIFFNLTSQASGSALIAGWNFMEVNIMGTTSGSSGSFNKSAAQTVFISITPTSSQAFTMAVDDLCHVDKKDLILPNVWQIGDATNNQLLHIASGRNGAYALGTNLLNNYAIESTNINKKNGNIFNGQLQFPTGSTALSGSIAKSIYAINSKNFDSSFSNKTLLMSSKYLTQDFAVINTPTSTSLVLKNNTGTNDALSFVAGDQMIVFSKRLNQNRFESFYNATLASNFKILTITGSTTTSGSSITVNHAESNSGVDSNGEYFVINRIKKFYYRAEQTTQAQSFIELTPSMFAIGSKPSIFNDFSNSKPLGTGTVFGNGWTNTVDVVQTITSPGWVYGDNKISLTPPSGGNLAVRLYRDLENYNLNHGYEITGQYRGSFENANGFNNSTGFFVYSSNTPFVNVGNVDTPSLFTGMGIVIRNGTSGVSNVRQLEIYANGVLKSNSSVLPINQNAYFNFRFNYLPSKIKGRLWIDSSNEPNDWQIDWDVDTFTNAGNVLTILGTIYSNGNQVGAQIIRNLKITSAIPEFVEKGSVSTQSGNKLTVATRLQIQNTSQNIADIETNALLT